LLSADDSHRGYSSVPKIAHIITTFNLGMMPATDVPQLMRDQRRGGWQPELVIGRHAVPELVEEVRQQGFPVHQIPSLRKYIHPLDELRTLLALVRLFKRRKFDIDHTHLPKAGIQGWLAARLAGVKIIIFTVYGLIFASALPRGKCHLLRSNA